MDWATRTREGRSMMMLLTGGCLCGAILNEIAQPPIKTYTCHSTDCQQRITNSAFSIGMVVPAGAVGLSGETRTVDSIANSGRIACGIWIGGMPRPGTQAPGMVRVIRAGTLDDTSWVRPTIHFWTDSRQPWVVLPEGDQQYETQPESTVR
jgi:hypothetical protein